MDTGCCLEDLTKSDNRLGQIARVSQENLCCQYTIMMMIMMMMMMMMMMINSNKQKTPHKNYLSIDSFKNQETYDELQIL